MTTPDTITTGLASPLTIDGVHCTTCGTTRYPRQHYGCEQCGAYGAALLDVDLAASGTLTSWATVYSHPTFATPFTVVEVFLDDGSLIRGLAADGSEPTDGRAPTVGARAIAVARGLGNHLAFAVQDPT